jgi:hypothetical protein
MRGDQTREPIIVVSHSGINVLRVELALLAVYGIASHCDHIHDHFKPLETRVPSKEHLYDAARSYR